MKLISSLDRACDRRMKAAARPRLAMLVIIGLALVAPLLSGTAIAAATGADQPAAMVATVGLLGGLALTGPLREEETGDPQGGGDDTKRTIGQRLSAAIASKATLQASIAERDTKIAEHAATIERLTGEIAAAQTSLAQANAKIATLEADAAEVDRALKAAEAEVAAEKGKNTTVEKKAQEKVASLGFSAAKLPAAEDGDQPDTLDEIRGKMATTTDSKELGRLAAKARELRLASN